VKRLKSILKSEQPTQKLFRNSQNTKEVTKWSQHFSIKGVVQNDLQSTLAVNGSHTREAGPTTTMSPKLFMMEL